MSTSEGRYMLDVVERIYGCKDGDPEGKSPKEKKTISLHMAESISEVCRI